jgi:hypothetical protein
LKFTADGDIEHKAFYQLLTQFKTFDKQKQGELEEDEAMHLLEKRGETKTFKELRAMVESIDLDRNRKLSFLEWACAIYKKSWQKLHTASVDPEEMKKAEALRAKALAEQEEAAAERAAADAASEKKIQEQQAAEKKAREATDSQKNLLEAIKNKKEAEEKLSQEEKKKKESALSQAGVKGKAAMFHFAAVDTKDPTMTNEQKIKAEAKNRREKTRAEEFQRLAEYEAKVAEEEAKKAEEEKKKADAAAAIAEAALAEAKAAADKAARGTEILEKEKQAYEASKKAKEAAEKQKKEQEEATRAAGRAKLADKSKLWK